jgi:2-polyprenyl-3-methyl-5-hydroxy-6-metoxy-1,4-benzoquinol methylase
VLRELQVRTLLDVPCGDGNWMRHVDLTGFNYIAADSSYEHIITYCGRKIANPPLSRRFILLNAIIEDLPAADVVLCRDFLQHLPTRKIYLVLENIWRSKAHWLLVTSHLNKENEDIMRDGDFRPLNLMAPPFSWSPPETAIEDGSNRILGLWPIIRR